MYPFESDRRFIRNLWCMAAWSAEVTRTPLERTIMDEPLVFFRTRAGAAVAMAGLCGHRHFPLAEGRLLDDAIVCTYHGYAYGPDGACVRVPGQREVPAAFRQRVYPVREVAGMVWIWTGDPAAADPALMPPLHELGIGDPGFDMVPNGRTHIKARWALMLDNLMDLSHIGFLHLKSIEAPVAGDAIAIQDSGEQFRVIRWLPGQGQNMPYVKNAFPGRVEPVDVELGTRFFTPVFLATWVHFYTPADSAGRRVLLARSNHMQGVTPETAHSTHGFSALVRDFRRGETDFDDWARTNVTQTRDEDAVALERLERAIARRDPGRGEMSTANDLNQIRLRRHLDRLLQREESGGR